MLAACRFQRIVSWQLNNPMGFIQDYLEYNNGNECPRNFHMWTAIVILSAAVSRRVYVKRGYFTHYPGLYVALVGEQGDGKSSAKDIGKDLLMEALPDVPIAASVTTREAICKFMASSESIRTYTDENGQLVEYHPYTLFVNELKNFLSVNPSGMINFLTDVYDVSNFINETKGKGTDIIPKPFLTMLACETPEWMIKNFRLETITGGFSRRLIIVYEIDSGTIKPRPAPPENSKVLFAKLKAHLKQLPLLKGEFKWTPEAVEFWDLWYVKNKAVANDCTDPIMRGYLKTKHVQLIKVVMNLAIAEYEPKLLLTQDLFMQGLAILDSIEKNMPKLSVAAGRNDLALPQQQIIELLERSGGILPEQELKRHSAKDLNPNEQFAVLNFLKSTKQIYYGKQVHGKVERMMIMTEAHYAKEVKAGNIKEII